MVRQSRIAGFLAARPAAFLAGTSLSLLLTSFLVLGPGGVSTDVQMPGTQPTEVPLFDSGACNPCHAGYDAAVEPGTNWKGSMMAQASRDPVFWAALAAAERGFADGGDICIRCHVNIGWTGGRSEPTDGSALLETDADGITCMLCHSLTNPDQSEWLGVQNAPFIANDGVEGFYGAGMYVLWDGPERLGPYNDAASPHLSLQSQYHRSSQLCGTCHDVSNPVTGDLAHNNGAQTPLAPGEFSGVPNGPVADKAAFKNPPYRYGIVERTFSEHWSSTLSTTRVSDYGTLPADLQGGSIERAYDAAMASTATGDYVDGAPRFFSCQTCHMPPVTGKGCNSGGAPTRNDLPLHDLTGGNYWAPDAIAYLDDTAAWGSSRLRLGGGLSTGDTDAMLAGKDRVFDNLQNSAALSLTGNTLKVVNQTGHKLITGYHEGRRMWLNVKWRDASHAIIREDGAYGDLGVTIDGSPATVRTILDLDDPNLRIYEADYGITQEWATELMTLGTAGTLPVTFDRETGAVTETIASLAAQPPGSAKKSFHFILNNFVIKDTRIPPYGMTLDEALERNMTPVPMTQYGNPGPGEEYDYFDTVDLDPPAGAAYASIDLLFQPTSWEYIQFLDQINDGSNAFLASTGDDLLEAWMNTGMAEPVVMASIFWADDAQAAAFCDAAELAACPCGNEGDPDSGCDVKQGTGGVRLRLLAQESQPLNRSTVLGTGYPALGNPAAIVIRGTGVEPAPVVFGDGLRCVSSPVVRLGAAFAFGGASTHTFGHGQGAGSGTFYYQLWFRNSPAMFCTPDAFNLSNGVELTWP
jgi:hypothetical protein